MKDIDVRKLFEPYDGENIKKLPDGNFAVCVRYAHEDPIVVTTRELALQIENAISEAYGSGSYAGMCD